MTAPDSRVLDAEIVMPAGVDRAAVLAPAYHSAWRMPGETGADYRRHVTRHDPLLFMITYFSHYLLDELTGTISFSRLHLHLCRSIARWALPAAEDRHAVIAPRDFAKSTYGFLLGPAWAMSHRHRRFPLAFSYTGDQAAGVLGNLAAELEHNALLLQDYPDMRIRRGRGSRTGGGVLTTVGGSGVGARGLRESSLGTRALQHRPDVLVGDDLEPLGGLPAERKADVLQTLVSGVLPMGRGPALVLGTTVGYGSIAHDLARHALGRPLTGGEWVDAQHFTATHWPAIVARDGEEEALWPQRRSLEWLRARRDSANPETRYDYSLNYGLDPDPTIRANAMAWTDDLLRVDPTIDPDFRVIVFDVATTDGPDSDATALVVVGYERARRLAVVEHAETLPGGDQLPMQERAWHYKRLYPRTLVRLRIETNQGGRLWVRNMSLPPGLETEERHESGASKADRIRVAHGHHVRGAVRYARELPQLWAQLRDYGARQGRIRHDDLVDVLAAGLDEVFAGELIS